ncbi:MAG: PQQ-dependent sugar dehydrogenase [Actinomycetota bacterium]|nr:PQQ-dependent sugar dehydrogenase [Actinomycetota bacterium]
MIRIRSAILLSLATLVAAGCGEKEEPEVTGPPVVTNPAGGGESSGTGGVALKEIGEFEDPVFVAQPRGDDALYVVEQTGQIIRVSPGAKRSTLLDISDEITAGGEQGLLSVAFAPDYARSGLFYVDYTNTNGDTRVVEYRTKNGRADRGSASVLLKVNQPYANHNGGLLLFDDEGNLLVGLGDGGSAGDPERNGQDLGTLLGKILRIDPTPPSGVARISEEYSIPPENPYAEGKTPPYVSDDGSRAEILAYGLRNPWRFSFDRKTGALWIGDVGQNELEEIDLLPEPGRDANFGWSAFEGTEPFNEDQEAPNAIDPVLTYGRDEGCSVTGGYVVRDRALESLYGRYLYADFCQGQLRSFSADEAEQGMATDDRALGLQVPSISSFGEDRAGRIYAISLDGPVFRLVPDG